MAWTVRRWTPGGGKFSVPVETGPGAHPDSYTVGTGSLQEVIGPQCGVNHPPPSTAEVKEIIELCLCYPLWAFTARSREKFYFTSDMEGIWLATLSEEKFGADKQDAASGNTTTFPFATGLFQFSTGTRNTLTLPWRSSMSPYTLQDNISNWNTTCSSLILST
jgi:hypothetical protein